jgi:transporter family protein
MLRLMKVFLLAALAGLCWGIGEVFTKSVLHTGKIGPLTAIALRSTIALPLLWVACVAALFWGVAGRLEPRNWLDAGTPTLLKLVCGSGLIAGAAGMICFYAALNLGEVSRVKPIAFSVAPATAVILGCLVLREPFTAQKAIAIVLILSGVILLTSNGGKS